MCDRVPIIIEIIKLAVMPTAKLTNSKGRMITPSLYLYDWKFYLFEQIVSVLLFNTWE
jgi:hypothetical protein